MEAPRNKYSAWNCHKVRLVVVCWDHQKLSQGQKEARFTPELLLHNSQQPLGSGDA